MKNAKLKVMIAGLVLGAMSFQAESAPASGVAAYGQGTRVGTAVRPGGRYYGQPVMTGHGAAAHHQTASTASGVAVDQPIVSGQETIVRDYAPEKQGAAYEAEQVEFDTFAE
jgi:hypothetical protein